MRQNILYECIQMCESVKNIWIKRFNVWIHKICSCALHAVLEYFPMCACIETFCTKVCSHTSKVCSYKKDLQLHIYLWVKKKLTQNSIVCVNVKFTATYQIHEYKSNLQKQVQYLVIKIYYFKYALFVGLGQAGLGLDGWFFLKIK